jgi:hypothetical protein
MVAGGTLAASPWSPASRGPTGNGDVTGPDLIQIAGLHRRHDPGRPAVTRYPEESVLGISAAGEDEPPWSGSSPACLGDSPGRRRSSAAQRRLRPAPRRTWRMRLLRAATQRPSVNDVLQWDAHAISEHDWPRLAPWPHPELRGRRRRCATLDTPCAKESVVAAAITSRP